MINGNEKNLPAEKHPLTVFASGLNNPRGLAFGPDGFLYVAEGGIGGANGAVTSTVGQCEQVPPPVGPYTGGKTGRISKIGPQGIRATLVDGLPSDTTSAKSGGLVSGVADVVFVGGKLFALLAAGGCSHGNPETPNGIIAVQPDGTWSLLADLSQFLADHPVANPDLEDHEPDGTWYSLAAFDGALYALDPHNGEIDRVDLTGEITRLVDISASQGHIVPTAICEFRGSFYVGNLTRFPLQQGAAKVLRITQAGAVTVFKTGLTNITGVLIDPRERMYVLESSVGVPNPARNTGRLVRIDLANHQEVIADGLSMPAAMTFGADGCIYLSNKGYAHAPGDGEILRIQVGE